MIATLSRLTLQMKRNATRRCKTLDALRKLTISGISRGIKTGATAHCNLEGIRLFSYAGVDVCNAEIKHLERGPRDYLQLVHGEKELAELSQRFKVVELADAVLRQVQLQQATLRYEGRL